MSSSMFDRLVDSFTDASFLHDRPAVERGVTALLREQKRLAEEQLAATEGRANTLIDAILAEAPEEVRGDD